MPPVAGEDEPLTHRPTYTIAVYAETRCVCAWWRCVCLKLRRAGRAEQHVAVQTASALLKQGGLWQGRKGGQHGQHMRRAHLTSAQVFMDSRLRMRALPLVQNAVGQAIAEPATNTAASVRMPRRTCTGTLSTPAEVMVYSRLSMRPASSSTSISLSAAAAPAPRTSACSQGSQPWPLTPFRCACHTARSPHGQTLDTC